MISGCGVYGIQNKIDGTIYVGSSRDLYHRLKFHESKLRRNVHQNIHLQRAVNRDGLNNFLFFVIEFVEIGRLIEEEKKWIDFYKSSGKIYNICLDPTITNGGVKRSDEFKKKVSDGLKKMWESGTRNRRFNTGTKGKRSKIFYNLLSPDGIQYSIVTNMTEFCIQHGLCRDYMYKVCDGSQKKHHGWTIYNEVLEK